VGGVILEKVSKRGVARGRDRGIAREREKERGRKREGERGISNVRKKETG